MIALPLVEVDISVRSPALIRPAAQITVIRCQQAGRVSKSFLSENQYVRQGSPLLLMESEFLTEKEKHEQEKIQWKQTAIHDLNAVMAAALESAPIVILDGPRGVGKTTSAARLVNSTVTFPRAEGRCRRRDRSLRDRARSEAGQEASA